MSKIADRVTVLDRGDIRFIGSVPELRASTDPRIQNLLNRRTEEEELDPEAYLRRLTGAPDTTVRT
jgi:phospholipid/cholesterol/gamma-HCH transport system ATP-binding protein